MRNLQYPIGEYTFDEADVKENKAKLIDYFSHFPQILEEEIDKLTDAELASIYREGGWSIRQLVHHLADSHINMYIRVKFALTENTPTIKGYDEVIWATLADISIDLSHSVSILKGIHARLAKLLSSLEEQDFQRTYFHNGSKRNYTLYEVLGMYVWHSKHHLEHIKIAKSTPWKK